MMGRKRHLPVGGRRLTSFIRLVKKPSNEKWMLAEALLLVSLTRFVICFLPFRVLAKLMGAGDRNGKKSLQHGPVDNRGSSNSVITDPAVALTVARAVKTVSHRVPWASECLVQASTAKIMLNRRNHTSTIFLGVNKDRLRADTLRPHAWLQAGSVVVLGGEELDNYVAVAVYQ